jgi:hypothetical protein
MRRRRFGVLILVASVVGAVLFLAAFAATSGHVQDVHDGTATVRAGGYFAFELVVYGEFTELRYRFSVEAGPNVDIYFFERDDFDRYLVGQPYSESAAALENVRSADESPYGSEGRYTAVIDNSDYGVARPGGADAVVRYYVGAGGVPGQTTDAYHARIALFVLGLGTLGIAFLVGFVLVVIGEPLASPKIVRS